MNDIMIRQGYELQSNNKFYRLYPDNEKQIHFIADYVCKVAGGRLAMFKDTTDFGIVRTYKGRSSNLPRYDTC